MRIKEEIMHFFHKQNFVIVSSIDGKGRPHCSCKGIIDISQDGRIYLLDLYMGSTYKNLKKNPYINIAAVDEHRFIGYCLKGRAKVVENKEMNPSITPRLKSRGINKGHTEPPPLIRAINDTVLRRECIKSDAMKDWQDKIAARVTHRIIKKIHGERGHPRHPEVLMPKPKYMISMDVEEIIDLTPDHLK